MPLAPEVKQRITIIGLIVVGVSAILFLVFAVFLNRATLTVVEKAPYTVQINDFKNEFCTQDTCVINLAPGKYHVKISKEGYKTFEQDIELGIFAKVAENPALEFIPLIHEVNEISITEMFAKLQVPEELKEFEPVFVGDGYLAYLKNNPDTLRQTLYVRGTEGGTLGPETAVTSFTRSLKSYRIILNLKDNTKIGVIDDTNDGSTFYVIDTTEKSRTNLFSYPYIKDVKWLPKSNNFIFEAREAGDLSTSIFSYEAEDKANNIPEKITKLSLAADLKNVVFEDEQNLLAVTKQSIQGSDNPTELEGELVILSENEATANISPIISSTTVNADSPKVVEYSLISNQARLIKNLENFSVIDETKLSETKKSLYLKSADKIIEFIFRD
jgi:hypothetical protein